jgi:hypothetical protein
MFDYEVHLGLYIIPQQTETNQFFRTSHLVLLLLTSDNHFHCSFTHTQSHQPAVERVLLIFIATWRIAAQSKLGKDVISSSTRLTRASRHRRAGLRRTPVLSTLPIVTLRPEQQHTERALPALSITFTCWRIQQKMCVTAHFHVRPEMTRIWTDKGVPRDFFGRKKILLVYARVWY